jgi:hypothetical protein
VGTAAIILQIACMYLFTALLKTSPAWRGDFSAVYYALSIDHYTSRLGYELLRFPGLLSVLTAASLTLEFAGPLLLLLPIGQRWARTLVPLAMIGFHLGLAMTMTLGTFPWICIVAWAALLPPAVWDFFGREVTSPGERVTSTGNSPLGHTMVILFVASVVLLNIRRLRDPQATVGPAQTIMKAAGLSQYWNMFAPGPYEYGGWVRIEGRTAGGRLVNLYRPAEPLPDEKPALVSAEYPTQHWRRCFVTLWEYPDPPYRDSVLRYFVGRWNASHSPDEQLAQARLVQVIEATPPPRSASLAPQASQNVLAEWFASPTGNNCPHSCE